LRAKQSNLSTARSGMTDCFAFTDWLAMTG
jgi:hypothetical protein